MESKNSIAAKYQPAAEEEALTLLKLATLFTVPASLTALIRLGVIDILAAAQDTAAMEMCRTRRFHSASQIVSHPKFTPLSPFTAVDSAASALDRLLRLVAAHGLLDSISTTTGCHAYSIYRISNHLVQPSETSTASIAPFFTLVHDPVLLRCFDHMEQAVMSTEVSPFYRKYKTDFFSYASKDPQFNNLFNMGMVSHSDFLMSALLRIYHGFDGLTSIVDVGGGIGVCCSKILARYPQLKAINFDLQHVIASAPRYDGVEHISGDMFVAIPKADAVFMKWILHDWDDERCIQILKNCLAAIPEKGKIIVVDIIVEDEVERTSESCVAYQLDVMMLAYTGGGRERTKQELNDIALSSGFRRVRFACKVHGMTVMELFKSPV
ncbi:hypothetical protein KP509_35G052500 [Ceratopteris richardii]|uniref:Uncharacterized protein n=1 Tax=Ceratopteris richardii TaxID=49495 RepID=A0A8T2QH05_CERRI|nr:hypothetical protein KP509_35G052500 [Ceratopteris richardii]